MGDQGDTNQALVEAVVREVLERLAGREASGVNGSKPASTSNSTSVERRIDQQVITVSSISGLLEGAQSIVVPQKAVITPAARDLLRASNVGVRRAAPVAGNASPAVVLAVAETGYEPAGLIERLRRDGYAVEQVARTGLKNVVDELADAAAKGGKAAVLLTGACELAVCMANRRRGVRAAIGSDRQAVRRAREQIGVNLLVVDPLLAAGFQLQQAIREFIEHFEAAGGGRWVEFID